MKFYQFTCWMTLSLLASGCFRPNVEPDPIVDVSSTFVIDILEPIGPEQAPFYLSLRSLGDQECRNYGIDYTFFFDPTHFSITIHDLSTPVECEPGQAPATTQIKLGKLETGVYSFNINLKGAVQNEGLLVVEPERLLWDWESLNGLILANPVVNRIPDGALWGYVSYEADSLQSIANQMVESLEAFSVPHTFATGSYSYFSVDNQQRVQFPFAPPFSRTLNFLFRHTATPVELENLAEAFRDDYPQGMSLYLVDDLGNIY